MSGLFGTDIVRDSHKSEEWYTPAWIFENLETEFDLDPCSPHDMDSVVPATTKFTVFDDGLNKPWSGNVWLNPPYGRNTGLWIQRFIEHKNGIALVFSRTDSAWCQNLMRASNAILFLAGRVEFIPGLENRHKKSRSGAGTAMFAIGEQNVLALSKLGDRGFLILPS